MRILADENVPEPYVSALRSDGHTVVYSRDVPDLGPAASDAAIIRHAERHGLAVISTDVKDFGDVEADVPILVAPRAMTGGGVRRAVNRLERFGFDPVTVGPIWLSTLVD